MSNYSHKLRMEKRDQLTLRAQSFATKTEDGESFPASDYAYVPDPDMPSTWKLRLTSSPGGDPDPHIVGAAIAALGKGFRGNKVQIPADKLEAVKDKVKAAWKKANSNKDEDEIPSFSNLLRKAELTAVVEEFYNKCHGEAGRFCETEGGPIKNVIHRVRYGPKEGPFTDMHNEAVKRGVKTGLPEPSEKDIREINRNLIRYEKSLKNDKKEIVSGKFRVNDYGETVFNDDDTAGLLDLVEKAYNEDGYNSDGWSNIYSAIQNAYANESVIRFEKKPLPPEPENSIRRRSDESFEDFLNRIATKPKY